MEVRIVEGPPKIIITQSDHFVVEGWNIDQKITGNPGQVILAARQMLHQLGIEPSPRILAHDFQESAASVVMVNHRQNEDMLGWTALHTWPEHRYVHLDLNADQMNMEDVRSAFGEAFRPGALSLDRPVDKLAHMVATIPVQDRAYTLPSGKLRLEELHNELLLALRLKKFGDEIFGSTNNKRRIIAAGLMESHSIVDAQKAKHQNPGYPVDTFAVVTVDLFTCTGTEGTKQAPEILERLFVPVETPTYRQVDYSEEQTDALEEAKMTGVLVRRIS